jgi:hypothetical protein
MSRCVIDVAFGEVVAAEQFAVSDNHAAYAEKCGADYIRLTSWTGQSGYGCSAKLAILPYLEQYDQTLYLDCDVVVTKRAPNIFDEVPVGYWAGIDEMGCVHIQPDHWQKIADTIADAITIPRFRQPFVWNGGVIMMPRGEGWILDPPKSPVPSEWTFDQVWLSMQVVRWERPHICLDRRWNQTPWMPDPERGNDRAFFIHQNDSERQTRHLRIKEHLEKHGL